MAKVVLDTNVVIDYLSAKREHHGDAAELIEGLLYGGDLPIVPAGCIKDAYYILCRHYHSEEIVRDRLDAFRKIALVADLDGTVMDIAFASKEPDLEGALVRATAELLHADAIITRDNEACRDSAIPCMDAHEYLMRMDESP